MNIRINKLIILVAVTLTSLLFAGVASAQRSGQSMSVQTGVVVAAQAVNLQSAAALPWAVSSVWQPHPETGAHPEESAIRRSAPALVR